MKFCSRCNNTGTITVYSACLGGELIMSPCPKCKPKREIKMTKEYYYLEKDLHVSGLNLSEVIEELQKQQERLTEEGCEHITLEFDTSDYGTRIYLSFKKPLTEEETKQKYKKEKERQELLEKVEYEQFLNLKKKLRKIKMNDTLIKLLHKVIDKQSTKEEEKEILEMLKKEREKEAKLNELDLQYSKLPVKGENEWEEVGTVGVDAGVIWVGDPCYILALPHCKKDKESSLPEDHSLYQPEKLPKSLGETWLEFCDKIHDNDYFPISLDKKIEWYEERIKKGYQEGQKATQFNYDLGHAGLGVCVPSGYGDGCYPVFVKRNKEGRISEVKVVFIEKEEEESDEEE